MGGQVTLPVRRRCHRLVAEPPAEVHAGAGDARRRAARRGEAADLHVQVVAGSCRRLCQGGAPLGSLQAPAARVPSRLPLPRPSWPARPPPPQTAACPAPVPASNSPSSGVLVPVLLLLNSYTRSVSPHVGTEGHSSLHRAGGTSAEARGARRIGRVVSGRVTDCFVICQLRIVPTTCSR